MPEWTAIIAAGGVATQFLIAHLSRRQITKQLDLQHLVSHRATATFVADKRQKWIDELRMDMAFHLALSQEIVWKWDGMRSRTALRVQEEALDVAGKVDMTKAGKIWQDAADAFSPDGEGGRQGRGGACPRAAGPVCGFSDTAHLSHGETDAPSRTPLSGHVVTATMGP